MRLSLVPTALLLCVLATGADTTGAEQPAAGKGPQIVFLVSEDPSNYEATRTIPVFAKMLQDRYGCCCKVIQGEGEPNAFRFPGLEAIKKADLLVVFFRRRALSTEQLGMIRQYLASGKPLVGIRTANHAFSVRGKVAPGYEMWWEFVPEVLGCGNHGYGPEKPGVNVAVPPDAANHPILAGVKLDKWHAEGCLYLVKPIDKKNTVLLTGSVNDKTEPIAWTRNYKQSRVFYTSLGYPTNFDSPDFCKFLANGLFWALDKPVPK